MTLNVTQQDDDKSKVARADAETILEEDAKIGGVTLSILGLLKNPPAGLPAALEALFPLEATDELLNFVETAAMATVRALRSQPVALPPHTVTSAPSASLHTGSIIYVSNGASGAPIIAFSDGASWLRSDTRTAISSS
jgi:hypothetical protein